MISLVSTVFNDREGIESFIGSMLRQTLLPDEIVIVDAGSRDGTWEFLQQEAERLDRSWKFRTFQEIRCNVARGRNLAIQLASGDLIASTDIGCDWDPEWLEELARPLLDQPAVELVSGSWAVRKGDLHGPWALTEWALKGEQRFVASAECHPSSRSVSYRKSVWQGLGGYPEDLTLAGDDAVFDFLIEKASITRTGAPLIRCYWHRHGTLKAFLKESWRYGLGDGEAMIRKKDVFLIGGRLLLEPALLLLGILLLVIGGRGGAMTGLLLALAGVASFSLRIPRMVPASVRLSRQGVRFAFARILLFSHGTKIFWLRGYVTGLFHGFRQCGTCRRRLRSMSPVRYREAKGSI